MGRRGDAARDSTASLERGILMARSLVATLATVLLLNPIGAARADEKADAILDKAIKALGGKDKLEKADAMSWKCKVTLRFQGNESEIDGEVTVQGLDHVKSVVDDGDGDSRSITVLNGDKGWMKYGQEEARSIEGDDLLERFTHELHTGRPVGTSR
ncbi:MAG TPA: hypothetical protein VG406_05200 [Isosphaeraceae bacterium]|nr:hypothetical protein [Isosphaeraceae bacterium]